MVSLVPHEHELQVLEKLINSEAHVRRKRRIPTYVPANPARRGQESVTDFFDLFLDLSEELPLWVAATKAHCVNFGSDTDRLELAPLDVGEMRQFLGCLLCVCCANGSTAMRDLWRREDGRVRPAWKLGVVAGMSRNRFDFILRFFTPSRPYTLAELKVSTVAPIFITVKVLVYLSGRRTVGHRFVPLSSASMRACCASSVPGLSWSSMSSCLRGVVVAGRTTDMTSSECRSVRRSNANQSQLVSLRHAS